MSEPDDKPVRVQNLTAGRSHSLQSPPGTVKFSVAHAPPGSAERVPFAGWRYEVIGYQWAHAGDLGDEGNACVVVGRSRGGYVVKLMPPELPPLPPIVVDLADPGQGQCARRRTEAPDVLVMRLRAFFMEQT